jgi:hypothetical protein
VKLKPIASNGSPEDPAPTLRYSQRQLGSAITVQRYLN